MKYTSILAMLYLFIYCSHPSYGQWENVWAFGTRAGLDFNSGVPVPVYTGIGVYPGTTYRNFGESSASVCDVNGEILFYTEGFYVWDRNGQVMPNGRGLTPVFNTGSITPTGSTSQGVVIVPAPGQRERYYIFSLTSVECWQNSAGRLYYSVVDLSLNGGMGDVVAAEKGILVDSFLAEKITSVAGDHCNVWLLSCSVSPAPGFKAYEITSQGLNSVPVLSDVGLGNALYPYGTFIASPDRKKIVATQSAAVFGNRGAALFDFNPTTGVASDPLQLLECCPAYGACFSPDNTKIYVATMNGILYQFDLRSGNTDTILASRTELGSPGFTQPKLAPDGKIYFQSRDNNSGGIGVVERPDNAGIACNYRAVALRLLPGQDMHAGLPNVVPVVRRDTILSDRTVSGACFANVNHLAIRAAETDGWDYQWNTGGRGSSLAVAAPGNYWVNYFTAPCTYHADTIFVSFPQGVLPDIHIRNSCKGRADGSAWATTYPGDTVTYHYVWQSKNGDTLSLTDFLSHVPAADYILNITTIGCDTNLFFSLQEEDHILSFDADSIVCEGEQLLFSNTSDTAYTQFYWYFGDRDSSSVESPVHTYAESGNYKVILTGIGPFCVDTADRTIIVDAPLSGIFFMSADSICRSQQVDFYTEGGAPIVYSRYWHFGNEEGSFVDSDVKMQHAFANTGPISVLLQTQFRACPDTSYIDTIYVSDLPKLDLRADSVLCLKGQTIVLSNLWSSTIGRYRCLWNTGDTTEYLHVRSPGIYSLNLVQEPLGCSSTESITIRKDCYTDIPNAFTPNDDGINDYFFPRPLLSKSIGSFSMQILNRWGQIVFETSNTKGRGWDGESNGMDQPEGVYVYSIVVIQINGAQENYQGNVTLIR